MVITPSTLNVLVIGASMIVFGFLLRMLAAFTSDTSIGQALAVIY